MSAEPVLALHGVWKSFVRTGGAPRTLKDAVLHPLRQWRGEDVWALQDVSLRVRAGETVGVIGANGAGKSTLLRLAGGVGRPTRGRIERRRAVAAIMTLGEAFDGLLSGRENAVTAGILAGYTRREAVAKLDEIAAFSELSEVLDDPVRTYSDGMRMRLAFSVAISIQPELLLIDEVLAVGDLRFQDKCVERLAELQAGGTTILLASHHDAHIDRLCDRVLWLARGRVQAVGTPAEIQEAYAEAMKLETERRAARSAGTAEQADGRFGTGELEIAAVRVDPASVAPPPAHGAAPIRVDIDLIAHAAVEDPIVGVTVWRVRDGAIVLDLSTEGDGVRMGRVSGAATASLVIDRLDVEPGAYRLDVGAYERDWTHVYDYRREAQTFDVRAGAARGFGPSRRWALRS